MGFGQVDDALVMKDDEKTAKVLSTNQLLQVMRKHLHIDLEPILHVDAFQCGEYIGKKERVKD